MIPKKLEFEIPCNSFDLNKKHPYYYKISHEEDCNDKIEMVYQDHTCLDYSKQKI